MNNEKPHYEEQSRQPTSLRGAKLTPTRHYEEQSDEVIRSMQRDCFSSFPDKSGQVAKTSNTIY